jgi:hypothetical protein
VLARPTASSLAGTSRSVTCHGWPTAKQHVPRSGDGVLQAGTPVPVTAPHVPLTMTFVPITSHSETAMIRTLSQCARPPPLVAQIPTRTGQSLSAANRFPSATPTDVRGGLHSSRVTQRNISQRRTFYVVATKCCPGSAAPRPTLYHGERGGARKYRWTKRRRRAMAIAQRELSTPSVSSPHPWRRGASCAHARVTASH